MWQHHVEKRQVNLISKMHYPNSSENLRKLSIKYCF